LYEGTSGGELGCIACDGQSRFIHIARSTTKSGDAQRAAQEMVWKDDSVVVDFGVRIGKPNRGRYGINLFINGTYGAGCAIETGSTSCRLDPAREWPPLKAGDRVTIIVGEAGTVDEDGVPIEKGDWVLNWWFVVEPTCQGEPCTNNTDQPATSPETTTKPSQFAAVASFTGDVTFSVGDGPPQPLTADTKLPRGAVIQTGVDAEVRLKFADGTVMRLDEMTSVHIADLLSKRSRQAVTVQLALGRVSATVNPKKAFITDFKVTTPSGAAGVRGTVFSVFYDPDAKVTVVATEEGEVSVDPVGAGLATTIVGAGQELVVEPTTMSEVQAAGTYQPDVQESDGASSGLLVSVAAVLVLVMAAGVFFLKQRSARTIAPD
jgi:hypothetical protein